MVTIHELGAIKSRAVHMTATDNLHVFRLEVGLVDVALDQRVSRMRMASRRTETSAQRGTRVVGWTLPIPTIADTHPGGHGQNLATHSLSRTVRTKATWRIR